MRILIIRHGDPDYQHDSLTEKGWREAHLLAKRMEKEQPTAIYCSPLGRAQATAQPTCAALHMTPVILDWLHEFPGRVDLNYRDAGLDADGEQHCPWNLPPQYWTHQPSFVTDAWREHPLFAGTGIPATFDRIETAWNALMAAHGYHRDGQIYRMHPQADRRQTIAVFCHHGLGLALVSAITHIPLPQTWQTLFLPTSSVTTVYMERYPVHRESESYARLVAVGDTSHLFAGDEPISSSGLHSQLLEP